MRSVPKIWLGRSLYRYYGKRVIDILLSGIGLIFLSPLFIVLSVLVWYKLGQPIFYRQRRPGFHAVPFTIIKFRTMTDTKDENGDLIPDGKRIQSIGSFLRKSSLDELPELVNVFRGEMSLVGPRPLLMDYLPLYNPEQARRHEVRPGITGWAQINGRNTITWEEKFSLDVWYVDNRSFLLGSENSGNDRMEGAEAGGDQCGGGGHDAGVHGNCHHYQEIRKCLNVSQSLVPVDTPRWWWTHCSLSGMRYWGSMTTTRPCWGWSRYRA